MKAFIIYRNGEKLCTAGIGTNGVLSAIVDWVGRSDKGNFNMHVGGLDSTTEEHVEWKVPAIGIGDEVSIRLIESAEADQPAERYKLTDSPT